MEGMQGEPRMARRRGNREGSIYRRKDGRWVSSLTLPLDRRKYYYGRTRQEVAGKLAAALRAREENLPIPGERLSLRQYLANWLTATRNSLRQSTWERYEALLRLHVVPHLGRASLARLTPNDLQRLFGTLVACGVSPATVRHVRAVMRKALNDAARWGLVARNVASLTSPPRVQRKEMTVLSSEQARALLECARGDRFEALYVVALTTGMRQGEILGLRWQDVDLDNDVVQVRNTLQRVRSGYVLSEPKTKRSRRQVALTGLAVAALRRHRARQAQEKLKMGELWQDHDLVFTNEIGGPVDAGNLRARSFSALLQRAGLPRIRFHDLRHTAATLMLGRGVHPKVVSEMLGHSQITITLDLYSHVTPTMQREAVAALESILALDA
jgi:integrase